MNDIEQLILLYEDVQMKRTGGKSVDREDISNFLFKITDGGRELFTIETIRKNDSKTDPSKRAGMVMKITGKLGSCAATRAASSTKIPELSTPVQYKKNNILRMCVTAINGIDYIKSHPPEKRTRSLDVTNITKIEAGGEIYYIN